MVTTALSIRDAMPMDRSEILQINRLAWEHCYSHIFTSREITGLFRAILPQHASWLPQRDNHLHTLVAEVDGVMVGFIGTASLKDARSAEITTFYLHPDYLRQGIGRQLWQSALNGLQMAGYRSVWVWALAKAEARYFYAAQGCARRETGIYCVGEHEEEAIGFWRQI